MKGSIDAGFGLRLYTGLSEEIRRKGPGPKV